MQKKTTLGSITSLSILSILCFQFPLAWGFAEQGEPRGKRCFHVQARIQSDITSEGCNSPVNLCTKGKTLGHPLLRGKTFYTTRSLGPTADDTSLQRNFSYAGELVIESRKGTLRVFDLGVVDTEGGHFSELSQNVTGEGLFEGASGQLFVHGDALETGFKGFIEGKVCLQSRSHQSKKLLN